jgi:alkylhydroperoxidase/carboxymuconolactone decarboxylase family protein YurZ
MNDCVKVTPLPVSDWDGSLAQTLDDMQGQPLNVHALMANHPDWLRAWWDFRNYSIAGGELGKRRAELVILRVALHVKAWYEWGSHVERALACGLTLEEIERVKQGAQAAGWTLDEAVLLQAVDELLADHAIAQNTLVELSRYYSHRQVMDLIAIQGMYVILGCMINSWGLELDDRVQQELPANVTRQQFELEYPRD